MHQRMRCMQCPLPHGQVGGHDCFCPHLEAWSSSVRSPVAPPRCPTGRLGAWLARAAAGRPSTERSAFAAPVFPARRGGTIPAPLRHPPRPLATRPAARRPLSLVCTLASSWLLAPTVGGGGDRQGYGPQPPPPLRRSREGPRRDSGISPPPRRRLRSTPAPCDTPSHMRHEQGRGGAVELGGWL